MSTIVTRAGKGSPLTYNEVDSNFTNLNTDKLQSGDTANVLTVNNITVNGGTITGITDLAVADGGTGASTPADARTNLGVTATGADTTYAFRANNLSDLANATTARTNLGLGSIATQSASNVSITGGSISGITDLAVADGGTGASDASTARTNLGLGTISTQSASNVSITGGSITGITDLTVSDGGTGVSTLTGIVKGNGTSAFSAATAGTDYAAPGTASTFTASQRGTVTTDNDGSFDMNVTNNFQCTPSGTFALTFTNITSGQSGYVLLINTGGHAVTAAATTKVNASFLAIVSAAGTYLLSYFSAGGNVYVTTSGAMS